MRLLRFLLLFAPCVLQAQWTVVPTQTTENLYDISFFGTQQLMVGTFKGVLYSDNNANSWQHLAVDPLVDGPSEVRGVYMNSTQSAVATGFFYLGNSQTIWKSSNNGFSNWVLTHTSNTGQFPPRSINALSFPSSQVGFAVGHNYSIVKTTDAGNTWQSVLNIEPQLFDVDFINLQFGLAIGKNILLSTSDGGQNWTPKTIVVDKGAVTIASNLVAFAAEGNTLYKTTDGAATWQQFDIQPFITDLLAISTDTLLAAAADGLWISTTGGLYWEVFTGTEGVSMNKLKKHNNVIWAVGNNGKVLKAENLINYKPQAGFEIQTPPHPWCHDISVALKNQGDPSWNYKWFQDGVLFSTEFEPTLYFEAPQPPSTSISLEIDHVHGTSSLAKVLGLSQLYAGLDIPIATEIYGCSGQLFTLDGTTPNANSYVWSIVGQSNGLSLSPVISLGFDTTTTMRLWAGDINGCVDNAYIKININTDFKDDVWRKTVVSPDARIIYTDFVDTKIGYATNNEGQIFKTTDGSKHWTQLTFGGGGANIARISFINADTGFVASNGLLRTYNGGVSFQNVSMMVPGAYWIQFYGSQRGFALNYHSIYRSVNGGSSFAKVYGGPYDLKDIDCPSDSICYCIGSLSFSENVVLKSTDGGVHWTPLPNPPTISGIQDVDAVDDTTLYIMGSQILKSTDGGLSWNNYPLSHSGGLHCIQMVDHLTGYASGGNELIKTEDGGSCWNVIRSGTNEGGNATNFSFPKPGFGFYGAKLSFIEQEGGVWRLQSGAYFEAPDPVCIPGTVTLENFSRVNGYDTFKWYIDDVFFSTEERPNWSVLDTGLYKIVLIASNPMSSDTNEQIIKVYSKAKTPALVGQPPQFCAGNDDLFTLENLPGYTYHWYWTPAVAVKNAVQTNNKISIYWEYEIPDTNVVLSYYAVSPEGCISDTVHINRTLFQFPAFVQVSPIIPEWLVCMEPDDPPQETVFSLSNLGQSDVTWQFNTPNPGWTMEALGDSVRLRYALVGNYSLISATANINNACFEASLEIGLHLVGPPVINTVFQDRVFDAGATVNLFISVSSWNLAPVEYYLFKDGVEIASPPSSIFQLTDDFSEQHEGLYYFEVKNPCYAVRSDSFLLSLKTSANNEPVNGNGSFILSPNPVQQELIADFKTPLLEDGNCLLFYNELGKKVKQVDIPKHTQKIQIPVMDLPAGVYTILKKDINGGTELRRFVKIK